MREQKNDPSLTPLFSEAISEKDVQFSPYGYFVQDAVLMRKWRPLTAPAHDACHVVNQIVVPTPYREEILGLAHDHHFSGHLGVNKTSERVLCHFLGGPEIKLNIAKYYKICNSFQIVGKPNQIIPPAPLQPFPVSTEPFERVILDCVGPLPHMKSGNQYLLTVMCTLTRFPEAIPLRRITAPLIIKRSCSPCLVFGR